MLLLRLLRLLRPLRQVVAVLMFIAGAAVVFSNAWDLSVGRVLATTGAICIIARLALRNVLADIFSGSALNREHPFRLHDFVLFHICGKREPVAGFVREVNWRSTAVLTPEDRAGHRDRLAPGPRRAGPLLGVGTVDAWVRRATRF